MITAKDIINTVQRLPLSEQKKVLEALQSSLQRKMRLTPPAINEDEVEKLLLAQGVISEIPTRLPDAEEETYQAIILKGKPPSEIILENREQ